MSTSIEASLRLEIAQYQAQLARAQGEAAKFKAKLKEQGRGLGNSFFGDFARTAAGVFGGNALTSGLSRAQDLMGGFVRRGFEFQASLNNAEVGITQILKRFDGLNDAAAKDEAAAAMRRIVEIEPQTAGSLQDLTSAFMMTLASAKGVGITTEQNVVLVGKFANALANAGLEINQLGQEYRSIVSGNIGADSSLAKILGITNADIAEIRANGGSMFDFLIGKLGAFGDAGDSASVTMSSFNSALDKAAGAFAEGMFDQGIDQLKELSTWLESNKQLFTDLGRAAADGMAIAADALRGTLDLVKEIKAWIDEPARIQALAEDIKANNAGGTGSRDVFVETTTKPAPGAAPPPAATSTGTGWFNGLVQQGMDAFSGGGKSRTSSSGGGGFISAMWRDYQARTREETEAQRKLEELRGRVATEAAAQAFERLDLTQKIATLENEIARQSTIATEAAKQGDESAKLTALMQQLELQRQLNGLLDERQRIQNRDAAAKAADIRARLLPGAMPAAGADEPTEPETPGKIHGYKRGQPWRGARRSARGFGGLDELYRMRGTASQFEMLQRSPSSWARMQGGDDQRNLGLAGRHVSNDAAASASSSRNSMPVTFSQKELEIFMAMKDALVEFIKG